MFKSPLTSIPFIVKLLVSIWFDGLGITFYFIPVPPLWVSYAGVQAVLSYAFWANPMLSILIGGAKAYPAVNMIPWLTFQCLWNGYKTGWRY